MTARRICFVGDSITAGTGDEGFIGWPALACRAERARGHEISPSHLGVRADTSRLIAARWRGECKARLKPGMNGALVFAFGVNDTAVEEGLGLRVPLADSLAAARAMLIDARNWLPTLWLGPIPVIEDMMPVRTAVATYHFVNARIADYNAAFAELAAELGIPYLDLFSALSADPQWLAAQRACDGVHPLEAGYVAIAALVERWPAWRALFDAP